MFELINFTKFHSAYCLFLFLPGRNLESLTGADPKAVKFVGSIVDGCDVPVAATPFIGIDSPTPIFNEELVFSCPPRVFCSWIRRGLMVKVEVSAAHDFCLFYCSS